MNKDKVWTTEEIRRVCDATIEGYLHQQNRAMMEIGDVVTDVTDDWRDLIDWVD